MLEWKSLIPKKTRYVNLHKCIKFQMGAFWKHLKIHGRWTQEELKLHINLLELKAVQFALNIYEDTKDQIHVILV